MYKPHVMLNLIQHRISERSCDPEINSGRRKRKILALIVLNTLGVIVMLMENCQTDCSKYGHMELKNVNKDIVSWLEDVIEENNSRICYEQHRWRN